MRLILADDSRQVLPTRPGMRGTLYAAGAVLIDGEEAGACEEMLHQLCLEYGFPSGERFKWSPGRELWMRDNLRAGPRQDFFVRVLRLLEARGCQAVVVVLDGTFACITARQDIERDLDAMRFLVARLTRVLTRLDEVGLVVMDQPGGGPRRQRDFAADCAIYWRSLDGSRSRRIVLAPISADSDFVRLLQAADIVTSCTLAYIAGEVTYSPQVFEHIRQLLCRDAETGETGLVVRPSFRYLNLYHWLLADPSYVRGPLRATLPLPRRPYNSGPWIY